MLKNTCLDANFGFDTAENEAVLLAVLLERNYMHAPSAASTLLTQVEVAPLRLCYSLLQVTRLERGLELRPFGIFPSFGQKNFSAE